MFWLSAAKWIGTGAGVSGAILIALNLGIVVYGFALFLLLSLLWGSVALVQRDLLQGVHGNQSARSLALGGSLKIARGVGTAGWSQPAGRSR